MLIGKLAGNYLYALLSATKGLADCGVIGKATHNSQLSEKRCLEAVAGRNGEDE